MSRAGPRGVARSCRQWITSTLPPERTTRAASDSKAIGCSQCRMLKSNAASCVPAEIDLADFRGREVSIAFIVDPLADPAGDWATWVTPRIVLR
jgi:hypothetical protein